MSVARLVLPLILGTSGTVDALANTWSSHVILSDGRLIAITEGAHEPRSVGSYSVRLYGAPGSGQAYDDFITGAIFARDGFVSDVSLDDLDGDGSPELIITVATAGSGRYASGRAFRFDGRTIAVAAETPLVARSDLAEALRAVARAESSSTLEAP